MKLAIRPFKNLRKSLRQRRRLSDRVLRKEIPEISKLEIALMRRYAPYTMTGVERQWALIKAIQYLNTGPIGGDIVECGVWRGGNMMLAKELCRELPGERKFYLFDTFAGMSEPTASDVTNAGTDARRKFRERTRLEYTDWSYAPIEEVRENFRNLGLLDASVIFVKGKVEETLTQEGNLPDQIALLRLDTDFYESTLAELRVLYPRLAHGGVLIVDDYGHWRGARQAVDEFFRNKNILWSRLDYTGRMTVKREAH